MELIALVYSSDWSVKWARTSPQTSSPALSICNDLTTHGGGHACLPGSLSTSTDDTIIMPWTEPEANAPPISVKPTDVLRPSEPGTLTTYPHLSGPAVMPSAPFYHTFPPPYPSHSTTLLILRLATICVLCTTLKSPTHPFTP